MKTLKLAFAASLVTVSAFVSIKAADVVLSPRATASAPRVVASGGHTTAAVSRPVVGSPRGLSTLPKTATPPAGSEAAAHCQTAQKGQCHMPCCG